ILPLLSSFPATSPDPAKLPTTGRPPLSDEHHTQPHITFISTDPPTTSPSRDHHGCHHLHATTSTLSSQSSPPSTTDIISTPTHPSSIPQKHHHQHHCPHPRLVTMPSPPQSSPSPYPPNHYIRVLMVLNQTWV
nr:hypothetical protein [Tanacetum cinerariifolium]